MRRVLLLLLSLLIPLKIAAAAIVPIAGLPALGVEHVTAHLHHAAAIDDQSMASDEACPHSGATGDDRLHGQGCPHLAMAALASVLPDLRLPHSPPLPPTEPAQCFISVVLDVLLPPPTGLA
jgi:hypothetical protein